MGFLAFQDAESSLAELKDQVSKSYCQLSKKGGADSSSVSPLSEHW